MMHGQALYRSFSSPSLPHSSHLHSSLRGASHLLLSFSLLRRTGSRASSHIRLCLVPTGSSLLRPPLSLAGLPLSFLVRSTVDFGRRSVLNTLALSFHSHHKASVSFPIPFTHESACATWYNIRPTQGPLCWTKSTHPSILAVSRCFLLSRSHYPGPPTLYPA